MIKHLDAFKANSELIAKYKHNAHLIWAMGLYLDNSNLNELASECLTDQTDDKKIDFIKLDLDNKKIIFAQGYYSERKVDGAPANKASDLNTAAAWLISGDTKKIPNPLKSIIIDCRSAIERNEIEQIDLLYVHNLSESVPVLSELKTVSKHLQNHLHITVIHKEIGLQSLEDMYMQQKSAILVKNKIVCPAQIKFEEHGQNWSSAILSVSGDWLRDLFKAHGDALFSANYRGFLGISKRKKINIGIKNTAEKQPNNFWVYNNGITILTSHYASTKENTTELIGVSIINGAQTTGSIGSLDEGTDISNVRVLCRLIKCENEETINEIVKYNNTQNEITTWDKFSNDTNQKAIHKEFSDIGYSYSLKRGFNSSSDQLGIEQVAQSLLALKGRYQDANRGKNSIFENNSLYKLAFDNAKARHILFAHCIARAIDERRSELKEKHSNNLLIEREEKQLTILRNLRFKYFFIAVFGKCLEDILEKKVEINLVGLNPDAIRNKKINDLIVEILPTISIVLTFTVNIINGNDFSELLDKDPLDDIANKVGVLIYSMKSSGMPISAFDDFKNIISHS